MSWSCLMIFMRYVVVGATFLLLDTHHFKTIFFHNKPSVWSQDLSTTNLEQDCFGEAAWYGCGMPQDFNTKPLASPFLSVWFSKGNRKPKMGLMFLGVVKFHTLA